MTKMETMIIKQLVVPKSPFTHHGCSEICSKHVALLRLFGNLWEKNVPFSYSEYSPKKEHKIFYFLFIFYEPLFIQLFPTESGAVF